MQTTAHPLPCEEVPGYNAFADIRFLGSSVTRPLVVTGSLGHWVTVGHCGSLWVTIMGRGSTWGPYLLTACEADERRCGFSISVTDALRGVFFYAYAGGKRALGRIPRLLPATTSGLYHIWKASHCLFQSGRYKSPPAHQLWQAFCSAI